MIAGLWLLLAGWLFLISFNQFGEDWPGLESGHIDCFGCDLPPHGRLMYAWVRFTGTDLVAVVDLARDLPDNGSVPPTLPPWQATLVKLALPPAGWQMP